MVRVKNSVAGTSSKGRKVGGEKVEGINMEKAWDNTSAQSWEKGMLSQALNVLRGMLLGWLLAVPASHAHPCDSP